MKKNVLTIIISVVCFCIVGLGIYFIINSNNGNNNTDNKILTNCKYNGEIKLGATFEKDNYLYTYVEVDNYGEKVLGWNVKYKDLESTQPITSPTCGKVNDKPIISTAMMYANSKATSIDVSTFDTTDVLDMAEMFFDTSAEEIKGLNKMNTSKVVYMDRMFLGSSAKTIDMSGLDTSNVTIMNSMFEYAKANSIILTDINTSNVTDMAKMFAFSSASELDLSSFDISKVISMEDIFTGCKTQNAYVGDSIQKDLWNIKANESILTW